MTRGWWRWVGLGVITLGLLAGWYWHLLPITLLEMVGMVSGLACTILAVDEQIANFPIGIINSLAYMALFCQGRLYGNMGLQVIFLGLGIQGWVLWTRRAAASVLPVTHITRGEMVVVPLVVVVATLVLTYILRQWGDPAPLLDAASTVLAMCGQYLLNRKRVENWFLGGISVILVILLGITQQLWLTAGLYACYGILCVLGYRAWIRQAHVSTAPIPVES